MYGLLITSWMHEYHICLVLWFFHQLLEWWPPLLLALGPISLPHTSPLILLRFSLVLMCVGRAVKRGTAIVQEFNRFCRRFYVLKIVLASKVSRLRPLFVPLWLKAGCVLRNKKSEEFALGQGLDSIKKQKEKPGRFWRWLRHQTMP